MPACWFPEPTWTRRPSFRHCGDRILITVLALPVLVVSLARAARGSARAAQVWIGLLGYIFYTYAGAAVGYHFNRLLLVYVTLFSASLFGLVAAAIGLDVAALERRFDEGTPRGPVVAFLALIAVMLGALEIGQNIAYVTTGRVPPGVVNAGGMTFFPYALDLGIIVPLAVLASVWLWRRRPWGYPLAGFLLIKGATMGLALLAMNWFQWRSAQPTDGPLNAFYAFLALGGIALSAWFLRHCREETTQRF